MLKDMLEDIQSEFSELMQKETNSDQYQCELEVIEDDFIKEDTPAGKCGGVELLNEARTIVCSNTMNDRLNLCYEDSLPTLRSMLFPR